MPKQPDKIITKIRATYGLRADLARACGTTRQNVQQWTRVPAKHVRTVAKMIGMPPEKIRPDIFGKPKRTKAK